MSPESSAEALYFALAVPFHALQRAQAKAVAIAPRLHQFGFTYVDFCATATGSGASQFNRDFITFSGTLCSRRQPEGRPG